MDEVEVRAEATDDFFRTVGAEVLSDDAGSADHAVHELRGRVSGLLRDTIGCSMTVSVVAPGSVPRSEGGKLSRVLDKRAGV